VLVVKKYFSLHILLRMALKTSMSALVMLHFQLLRVPALALLLRLLVLVACSEFGELETAQVFRMNAILLPGTILKRCSGSIRSEIPTKGSTPKLQVPLPGFKVMPRGFLSASPRPLRQAPPGCSALLSPWVCTLA
jgi:hypothetical protein